MSPDFKTFEFISKGKNGMILKRVGFISTDRPYVFNLGLGDVDESGNVFDTTITNNGDTHKVLNTIHMIVLEFLRHGKLNSVIIQGNTLSRKRLFKIYISANLSQITGDLEIFGFNKGVWEKFERKNEYYIFLIRKKK